MEIEFSCQSKMQTMRKNVPTHAPPQKILLQSVQVSSISQRKKTQRKAYCQGNVITLHNIGTLEAGAIYAEENTKTVVILCSIISGTRKTKKYILNLGTPAITASMYSLKSGKRQLDFSSCVVDTIKPLRPLPNTETPHAKDCTMLYVPPFVDTIEEEAVRTDITREFQHSLCQN